MKPHINSANSNFTRRVFLKRVGVGVAGLGLAGALPRASWALPSPALHLPRSLPEAQGVSSAGILNFVEAIEAGKLNLHSLMMLRHGHVVAEGWWAPYAADLRHTLYSLSKSFTSTAIGLAIAEGHLRVDDKVASFFQDELPATVSLNLAAMKIQDLLRMGTGHAKEALLDPDFIPPDGNWVKAILAQPVKFAPSTHFTYNNAAPYLMSAILQKATGQTLLQYIKPRLFDPLGIEGADWEVSPQGINTGGWGLRVKTEDIAKVGQFYLQKGQWNGKQLLPEKWIEQATRRQIETALTAELSQAQAQASDWAQGYGYQFWRCRHDGYRGDGAFGQFCIVLPREDAVIVMTSETGDMQGVLNNVWNHLLPAIQGGALAADDKVQAQLKQRLASLALPLPVGLSTSPTAARIDKKSYAIADNPQSIKRVSLAFGRDRCEFTMQDALGEHRITCGFGRWLPGETNLSAVPMKLVPTSGPEEGKMKIACNAAWSDENTLVMQWRFVETAHYQQVTCRFDADDLRVQFKKSLAIINPNISDQRAVLVGKL